MKEKETKENTDNQETLIIEEDGMLENQCSDRGLKRKATELQDRTD